MASKPLAVVTGASRRLGKAFAFALAREGYAIALHYWASGQAAQETAGELEALGAPVFSLRADLTDASGIGRLFDELDHVPHALSVFVNSAAAFGDSSIESMAATEWDSILNLNLRAPFLCAQNAAARMKSGGLIINISDIGARKNWSRYSAYTVSKAGLDALTRVLARAFAPRIRVNAIAPGLILRSGDTAEPDWKSLLGRVPMQRSGTVEDLASALRFLLHNEYVTGQVLAVDGGYALV